VRRDEWCRAVHPVAFTTPTGHPLSFTSHAQLALPLYKRYPRSSKAPQSLLVVEFQTHTWCVLACSLTLLVHYRSVIGHTRLSNVVVRSSHEPSLVHGTECTPSIGTRTGLCTLCGSNGFHASDGDACRTEALPQLFRVRSPLLPESSFDDCQEGTEMFQFPSPLQVAGGSRRSCLLRMDHTPSGEVFLVRDQAIMGPSPK